MEEIAFTQLIQIAGEITSMIIMLAWLRDAIAERNYYRDRLYDAYRPPAPPQQVDANVQ